MDNLYNQYRKGDTWNGRSLTFPFSLVGVSIVAQFKRDPDSAAVFEYKTADATITTDLALNKCFFMPRKMDYPKGVYYYDIQLTFPNGTVKSYAADKLIIFQDVTK